MHASLRTHGAAGLRLAAGLCAALLVCDPALSANPTSNGPADLDSRTTPVSAPSGSLKGAARRHNAPNRPVTQARGPAAMAPPAGTVGPQAAAALGPQFEWVPAPGSGLRQVTTGGEKRLTIRETSTSGTPISTLEIDEAPPPPRQERAKPKVWATAADDLVNPITGNLLRDGLLEFDRGPQIIAHRIANEVWNIGDRTIRLGVDNNRVARFQLIAELGGKHRRLVVKADDLTGPRPLPAGRCVFISRFWYTLAAGQRRVDGYWDRPTLIPVFEPLLVPPADNPVPGQTNQAFMVEVRIPKQVLSGTYKTTVHVTDLDDPTYAEDVYVQVAAWPHTRQMRSIR